MVIAMGSTVDIIFSLVAGGGFTAICFYILYGGESKDTEK